MRTGMIAAITLLIAGFANSVFAAQSSTQVSPSAINLAASGYEVTIHVEVPYGDVVSADASLTDARGVYFDLPIESTSADGQGHLVVKIDWTAFTSANKVSVGIVEFGVSGWLGAETNSGREPFEGTDEATIINVTGRK